MKPQWNFPGLIIVVLGAAVLADNGCLDGPGCRVHRADFYSYGQALTLVRREGQSISLTCHGDDSGQPSAVWKFNLQQLYAKDAGKYHVRRSTLSIHALRPRDEGIYRCEKTMSGKLHLTEYRLFVFGNDEPRPLAGPIIPEMTSRVKEGGMVTLRCRVPARTSAAVEWVQMFGDPHQTIPEEMPYMDMLNIKNLWRLERITRTFYDQRDMSEDMETSYTIDSVKPHQGGRYACMIIHPDGVWTKTVDLTVEPGDPVVVAAGYPLPDNLFGSKKHDVIIKEKPQSSIWSYVMVACGALAICLLMATIAFVSVRLCRDKDSRQEETKKYRQMNIGPGHEKDGCAV